MCISLNFIHQKRILHRDLKTSNIFLSLEGDVKIGDFGISKVLENSIDSASTIVGTPFYMSPEVCENRSYTFKSDIWALGCIMFELCTLKKAFEANNLLGLVNKIVKENVPDMGNKYSPELTTIVK